MKTYLTLFIALLCACASAAVKLPSIFSDNMVLQAEAPVAIWGKAEPNSTIEIAFLGQLKKTDADAKGAWRLKLDAMPKNKTPQNLQIFESGKLSKTIKNVLVGEVWITGGQSNMEMPMKGYGNQPILGSNEAIATSSNPEIRMFTVKKASSLQTQSDFEGTWMVCEPENVSEFSATAYYFGLMLNKALKVPIGLINSSWGGTRIEPWISEDGIKKFEFVKMPDKNQQGPLSQQTPTVLFNAMISPMVGYGIKGAIWYQGESNRNEASDYVKLMPGLIENWRSVWGVGDFSFFYVQIAPFDYGPSGLNSAYLREAQLKASTALQNIGMASIMDIGEKDCIHPANKKAGGDRLAWLALTNTYGMKGFTGAGPVLKEMTVSGSMVKLTFNNAPNGITSFGKELSCFEIAGSNKRFYPAIASFSLGGITLYNSSVAEPIAVRYAFKDFVVGDLFNIEGIPASSFRTDSWE